MAEIAVIVPTYRRADKLPALLANIAEATTTTYNIYLIIESTDEATKQASERLDTVDVIGHFGSCAEAWNAGYRASNEPYVFVTNDDVVFHSGWDGEALAALDDAPIVGVNDGHGRMASFLIVRRTYIEQHSGVFDRPNTLVHPYRHNYVDTELADYAKHRGVWGEAPDAVVEHMHYDFGKADPDHPNYVRSRATCAEDHATYLRRRREWEA